MITLLFAMVILGITITALRHPWVGVMGWTWVSLMNPHQLTWRLDTLPVAAAVGGATLLGFFLTSDRKNLFLVRENLVLILLMLWMTIGLPFSFLYDSSLSLWNRVMKIDLMILVAIALLHTRRHILWLTWIVVGSMAFYGVKGGFFTIITGGSFRVWGPANSYVEGNNELAVALVMTIPLLRFLQTTITSRWGRHAMTISMLLCAAAALGTHSRGALLAIFAMSVVLWWRSPKKALGAIGFVIAGVALLAFMPEHWWDRMNTIQSYEEDDSALGRINAWWTAYNIAKQNLFGGGFMIYTPNIFAIYAPEPDRVHAAHSIYFMVLGELGFPGLLLWLMLWFFTFFKLGRIRKQALKQPETRWLSELGSMGQVSLVGYAVGGAFLSLSYWDMPYNIMVLAVIGWRWIENKAWLQEKDEPMLPWFKRKPIKAASPLTGLKPAAR